MDGEVLQIIISSGVVSALVSFLFLTLYIGKYKEKIDRHDRDNDKLNNKLAEISDRLANIEGGLERDRAQSQYIQSKSPLGLTDKGKALLIDSTGKDYIDSKKMEFFKEMKSKKPKTAYDVQELSKEIIANRIYRDEFNSIKEFAFVKGVTLDVVLDVLSIYLRDFLLIELGFKVQDIKN